MNARAAMFGAVAFASLLSAADTAIEFSGVMTAGGKTRIALTDKNRKTTTWVETGQDFNGYTVARYDDKEEAVFLKKNGRETRIPLVTAKSPEARPATAAAAVAAATPTDATSVAIRSNLRLLAATARQYQAERGATTVSYADLVGPGKPIRELKPVAGENYSTLNFGPNVTAVSVTTATGSTVTYDVNPASAAASAVTTFPSPAGATAAAPPANVSVTAPPVPTPPTPAAENLPPTGRAPGPSSYTVQNGDTLEKISTATGVPVPQLKMLNPTISDAAGLTAGQTLRVK